MSTPHDDLHPIVREWMAFSADHMRKVATAGGDSFDVTLEAHGLRADLADPIARIINANVDVVRERVRLDGNPSQAVGDAMLAAILFGIRLARKGLA